MKKPTLVFLFIFRNTKMPNKMVIKVDRRQVFEVMKLQKIKLEEVLEIFPSKPLFPR